MDTDDKLAEAVRDALEPAALALGADDWTLDVQVEPRGGALARVWGLGPGAVLTVVVPVPSALPEACARAVYDRLDASWQTAAAVAREAAARADRWGAALAALGRHDWRFTVGAGRYAVVEARCARCGLERERRRVEGQGAEILFLVSYSADGVRWVCPARVPPCRPPRVFP